MHCSLSKLTNLLVEKTLFDISNLKNYQKVKMPITQKLEVI